MANVSIEIDKKQLGGIKDKLKKLNPDQQKWIFARAMRRTGTTAKKAISDEIRKTYTVQAAAVKKDMRLLISGMNAAIEVKGTQHSLAKFKAKPAFTLEGEATGKKPWNIGKPSPTIKIRHDSEGKQITGSFWGMMSSGHKGLFVRGEYANASKTQELRDKLDSLISLGYSGKGHRERYHKSKPKELQRADNLPIAERTGISTAQMVGTISDTTDIQDKILDTLNKRVDHELQCILS